MARNQRKIASQSTRENTVRRYHREKDGSTKSHRSVRDIITAGQIVSHPKTGGRGSERRVRERDLPLKRAKAHQEQRFPATGAAESKSR